MENEEWQQIAVYFQERVAQITANYEGDIAMLKFNQTKQLADKQAVIDELSVKLSESNNVQKK